MRAVGPPSIVEKVVSEQDQARDERDRDQYLVLKRIVVVMPAYNAARTLELTYQNIPVEWVTKIILVDDASHDETLEVARRLPLEVIRHHRNVGYGGNQKTC